MPPAWTGTHPSTASPAATDWPLESPPMTVVPSVPGASRTFTASVAYSTRPVIRLSTGGRVVAGAGAAGGGDEAGAAGGGDDSVGSGAARCAETGGVAGVVVADGPSATDV